MSTPDYPTFSKRIQRSKRNWRGAYNFDKSTKCQVAEKWFQERREQRALAASLPEPVRLPPGLPIPTCTSKKCTKCLVPLNSPITMRCCNTILCFKCAINQADLINRCFHCNKVIDQSRYEEYDGLNLVIPSYDEFNYVNPDEICCSNIVVDQAHQTSLENNSEYIIDMINFQLNFQYMLFMAMYSQCFQMKEQ